MDDIQLNLIDIYVLKNKIYYKGSKKIITKDVTYHMTSDISLDNPKEVQVLLECTLVNTKNNIKYASFEIGFVYQYSQKKMEERKIVAHALWEGYSMMKGIIFSELANTQFQKLIPPNVTLQQFIKQIKPVPATRKKPPKKLRK